jgi:hypothetical protein
MEERYSESRLHVAQAKGPEVMRDCKLMVELRSDTILAYTSVHLHPILHSIECGVILATEQPVAHCDLDLVEVLILCHVISEYFGMRLLRNS